MAYVSDSDNNHDPGAHNRSGHWADFTSGPRYVRQCHNLRAMLAGGRRPSIDPEFRPCQQRYHHRGNFRVARRVHIFVPFAGHNWWHNPRRRNVYNPNREYFSGNRIGRSHGLRFHKRLHRLNQRQQRDDRHVRAVRPAWRLRNQPYPLQLQFHVRHTLDRHRRQRPTGDSRTRRRSDHYVAAAHRHRDCRQPRGRRFRPGLNLSGRVHAVAELRRDIHPHLHSGDPQNRPIPPNWSHLTNNYRVSGSGDHIPCRLRT